MLHQITNIYKHDGMGPSLGSCRLPSKFIFITEISTCTRIAWEQKNHQQAADGNFKMKTCNQFLRSLMQQLPN